MTTSSERSPASHADVCIIGAGVAGALVADSLTEAGYSVVVLEAGPRFDTSYETLISRMETAIRPEHSIRDVWPEGIDPDRDAFSAETPDGARCRLNETRLKGVGGTTHHWGGESPRLYPSDFNMRSTKGLAVDWPIAYEDLRPYYAAAERELGVAGGGDNPFVPRTEPPPMTHNHAPTPADERFIEACEELGIRTHRTPWAIATEPYDGRDGCRGYGTCSPVCPSGARYSAITHIRRAEASGARVIDQVPVQRLEHDDAGSAVTAAVYRTPEGRQFRQTADQFVIACGGIETPRLLLLSDSEQYPEGLANSSGVVGQYLFGSAFVPVVGRLDEQTNSQPVPYNTVATGEFYDHDDHTGSIRITSSNHSPRSLAATALTGGRPPVGQLLTDPSFDNSLAEPITGSQWGEALVDRLDESRSYSRIGLLAQLEVLPQRENAVSLSSSKTDSHGNPAPHISYTPDPHATAVGREAIERMTTVLDAMGAEIVHTGDPTRQPLTSHHKGTTRMGTDPTRSVVDACCRTHDLDNCWIASSSVFPTGGAVNPTLTIAALALKTADHITEEL